VLSSTSLQSEGRCDVSNEGVLAIDAMFRQHLQEFPFWQNVVDAITEDFERVIRLLRIPGKVESRAKSTGSVIGKAYRKPGEYSVLASFGDLAAARILVPFASDVELVVRELSGHPDLTLRKDDEKVRKVNELTYQARHLDFILDPSFRVVPPPEFGDRQVRCEVQIQTFAQSLWASVSHLVTYKRELPEDVHRRVNRLVVLCELFDDEAEQSRALALASVDAVGLIASELQRYYFGITGRAHDPYQSMAIVSRLLPAFEESESSTYTEVLDKFVGSYGDRLAQLLTDRPEARGLSWLLRPEAILVFERITNGPMKFARVWDEQFLQADREGLAAAWGPIK
jgi:ppGpp synthetase/RelA/SpoT-type nucleotidyltranferase